MKFDKNTRYKVEFDGPFGKYFPFIEVNGTFKLLSVVYGDLVRDYDLSNTRYPKELLAQSTDPDVCKKGIITFMNVVADIENGKIPLKPTRSPDEVGTFEELAFFSEI